MWEYFFYTTLVRLLNMGDSDNEEELNDLINNDLNGEVIEATARRGYITRHFS